MAKYSKRYLSRNFSRIALIVILLVFTPPILINLFLNSHREDIEKFLADYFKQSLSVQNVYYLPPNSLILDNLLVFIEGTHPRSQQMFSKKVKLTFSLNKFIAEKKLSLVKVSLDGLQLDYIEYILSPEEIIQQAKKLIKILDKNQTYSVLMRDAFFALPSQAGTAGYMVVDVDLAIRPSKFISCKGSIGLTSSALREESWEKNLDYNFRGSFKRGGINIERAEFQKGDLYLKLWGAISGDLLRLNGNLFSAKLLKTSFKRKPSLYITMFFRNKLKKIFPDLDEPIPEFIGPTKSGLNIFDLGCLVKFVPEELQIKNLNFSLGKVPFSLKGNIPFSETGKINLRFSSFPNLPEDKRLENPKWVDFRLVGDLKDAEFNGKLDFGFIRKAQTKLALQKIEASLKNLDLDFVGFQRLKTSSEEIKLTYTNEDNLYNIVFNDFDCLLNPDQKKIKFNSKVYGGNIKGETEIDLNRFPFRSSSRFDLNEIDVNQLSSVSSYFAKVYGRLDAQAKHENYPASVLSGNLSISEGYLDNLRFFSWLSDFFSMPALKEVSFEELSADFLVDGEGSGLNNIMIDSQQIDLEGYFNIHADDLVSGKLSLILSEQLLESSPKFQKLLRLIGKDSSNVSFNFQMSGLYENMNFKWLESEFKNGLEELISTRREERLEEDIEQAIATISSDK